MKTKNVIKIFVNWNSEESIKSAEKLKTNLENSGYTQIKTISRMDVSTLFYTKT